MGPPLTRRRIGLLGGSFDPPHLAHQALGRLAMQALRLDELRWLPAGAPWQKAGRRMAPAEHRAAMLALLVGDAPGQVIDARELRRQGPTYTLDTVIALQDEWAASGQPPAEWLLILGQDQFARFDTWQRWPELLQRVTLAVAGRDGQAPAAAPALAGMAYRCERLAMPTMDISASAVRQQRAAGQPVSALVGEAVARYIDQHQLYPPDKRPVLS